MMPKREPEEVKRALAWLEAAAGYERAAGACEPNAQIVLELLTYRDWLDRERVAQLTAHRACGGNEHDGIGKLHGHCVVCLVPWPCEYAGAPR